ncbi:MAG: DUF4157 domain-containing protein, partial [Chloroflexota bacterium]
MKQQTTVDPKKQATTLLAGGLHRPPFQPVPAGRTAPVTGSTFNHDFSQMPSHSHACPIFPRRCPFGGACHTCPARVQAKLRINQAGDKYEQEADRVAEQVMRMPEPRISEETPVRSQAQGICIQRACPDCDDELQRQPLEEEEEEEEEEGPIRAKFAGNRQLQGQEADSSAVPPVVHEVLRSPGRPLDPATREFMEPRFGHDFSRVRVHTDAKAAESAEAVDSLAFTIGQDVVFNEGHYAPATAVGRQLLAHELAHVVQQNGTFELLQRRCGEKTPPSQNQATIRAEIVRHGEAQVGEHYLWSAEGEHPGEGDVIDHPFYQCVAQVAGGCVCAGKHLDPQVSARPRMQQTVSEAELEGYIGTHSFLRQEGAGNCGGGCGATAGSDIWGDCCIGHRHFDCSGFVFWCYNQAGYNVSRLTVSGYQTCDRGITQADLQPGDLCYIGNTHVGIYAGNGRVVEARSHAHGVVLSGLAG